MPADKDKKVSRLFLFAGPRKKAPGGRGAAAPKERSPRQQLALRLGLLAVLAAATVFMAYPMPEAYNMSFRLGEIADRDLKADRELMIADHVATAQKKDEARRTSPTVFDLDDLAAQGVREQLHQIFSRGRAIFDAPPPAAPV